MGVEENLDMLDEWMEAYNGHDFDRFAQPLAESVLYYAPNLAEPLKGREAVRKHFAQHPIMFPDTHLAKVRSFGQGDLACVEFLWTATNKGPLPGPGGQTIPATNRAVRLQFAIVLTLDRRAIIEAREYWDQLAFLKQLGLSP